MYILVSKFYCCLLLGWLIFFFVSPFFLQLQYQSSDAYILVEMNYCIVSELVWQITASYMCEYKYVHICKYIPYLCMYKLFIFRLSLLVAPSAGCIVKWEKKTQKKKSKDKKKIRLWSFRHDHNALSTFFTNAEKNKAWFI